MRVHIYKDRDGKLYLSEYAGGIGFVKSVTIKKSDWVNYRKAEDEWRFMEGWVDSLVDPEEEEYDPRDSDAMGPMS